MDRLSLPLNVNGEGTHRFDSPTRYSCCRGRSLWQVIEESQPARNDRLNSIHRSRQDFVGGNLVRVCIKPLFDAMTPGKPQFRVDVNNRDPRLDSRDEILVSSSGAAVQCQECASLLFNLPDALDIESLLSLASHHRGEETMHASD